MRTILLCINTHNEGVDLERTVENFIQTAPNANVVISIVADGTDDGSTDHFESRDDVLIVKPEKRVGIGEAKHLSVTHGLEAFGAPDFIFHTDGHAHWFQGNLADMAEFALSQDHPCIVTPRVGPLSCASMGTCPNAKKRGVCQVTCPNIVDTNTMPGNCYAGGGFRIQKGNNDGSMDLGLAVNLGIDNGMDEVKLSTAVNFSAFGFTLETYLRLAGWNRFPGWWGSQELGISLRAWFTAVPIYVLRDQVLLHRYRSWNHPEGKAIGPYDVPHGHREANARYAVSVVFGMETVRDVWFPHWKRLYGDTGFTLWESSRWQEQHDAFQTMKQRNDAEFFSQELDLLDPKELKLHPEASGAIYAVKAGIGNVLLCVPAIKSLAEIAHQPVDVYDNGVRGQEILELLEKQPFVRKVLHKLPTQDELRFYKFYSGSYWGRIPVPFLPVGSKAQDVEQAWRTKHEVECNMEAVRALGYLGITPSPSLSTFEQPAVEPSLPSDYLVVGVGSAGMQHKRYPHWARFCERIRNQPGAPTLVFAGTAGDSQPWMNTFGVDLCGLTTVASAAGLLWASRGYIGLDNGLSHLAAAVGCPSLLLYGPTVERKNSPWSPNVTIVRHDGFACKGCFDSARESKCSALENGAHPCMDAISPQWLVGRVFAWLNGSGWERVSSHDRFLSAKQTLVNEGIVAFQIYTEIEELIELLRGHHLERVVEIGAYAGGWSLLMAITLRNPEMRFLMIDPKPQPKMARTLELLKPLSSYCGLFQMPSDDAIEPTRQWLREQGGPIDVLHIDGNHELHQALTDYENYSPLVRPGGFIVFHDTQHVLATHSLGAKHVFQYFQQQRVGQTWEFFDCKGERMDGAKRGIGIGVIRVPGSHQAAIRLLEQRKVV